MTLGSLQEVARSLISLRLVTIEQLDDALADLGKGSAKELLAHLEGRGLLTSFQISKLENDETTGYYLGRFKLLYRISAGTFARVYRGVDSVTGEVVAVKVLRGRHASDPENIRQFHREGELTESFQHPNITQMLEVGIDQDSHQHYIAMEFVEGGNFREFLKIRGKFDPAETIRLGREMVDGLRYAFSKGVTHRDIKPTNILLSAQGHVKWVDFGLGGVGDEKGAPQQRTVDYAGLEKATGAPKGDHRSDIFFLGAVLHQMLTGQPPMPETKDKNARMLRARFDQIRPLTGDPQFPAELAAVIDKMLAFRPAQRYQDYDSLIADFDALLAAERKSVKVAESAAELTKNPRVVIIHRSPKVQEIIKDRLVKKGYQVVLTTDINRAISLMDHRPAHCLIIDLETTGREGVDAVSRYHKKHGPSCAAIYLADEDQMNWSSGMDGEKTVTLQKPVTLGPVYSAVKKLAPRSGSS